MSSSVSFPPGKHECRVERLFLQFSVAHEVHPLCLSDHLKYDFGSGTITTREPVHLKRAQSELAKRHQTLSKNLKTANWMDSYTVRRMKFPGRYRRSWCKAFRSLCNMHRHAGLLLDRHYTVSRIWKIPVMYAVLGRR